VTGHAEGLEVVGRVRAAFDSGVFGGERTGAAVRIAASLSPERPSVPLGKNGDTTLRSYGGCKVGRDGYLHFDRVLRTDG
jgi:hypothetical protein